MPDLFTQAELDDLRRTIRDLSMPGTAHLLRGTYVPNGLGGHTQTLGTVSYGGTTHIPVRYTVNTPREQVVAEAVRGITAWTVTMPAEWDVELGDLVYIFGVNRTVAVQGIRAPSTYEMQRRLICSEERS